jgi:hypothetical protein
MPVKNSTEEVQGILLTPQERETCRNIAAGKSLDSQRAKALLVLDEGATQEQAAQQAGLTRSQVKYWLGKFRGERLNAFPEEILANAQVESQAPKVETSREAEPAVSDDQAEQSEKQTEQEEKSKGTKQKKSKQAKKTKGKAKKKGAKKKKGKKKKKSKKKGKR